MGIGLAGGGLGAGIATDMVTYTVGEAALGTWGGTAFVDFTSAVTASLNMQLAQGRQPDGPEVMRDGLLGAGLGLAFRTAGTLLDGSGAAASAPRTGPGVFRADADLLHARLGPARLSHPEEYAQIMRELEAAGVQIDSRAGSLAYSPATGGPGRMVLDPDASIGALRHEYQHFLDNQAANFPGLGHYYQDLPEFARVEVRGYMREIATARQTGHADLVPQIVEQMRQRVREVLGR